MSLLLLNIYEGIPLFSVIKGNKSPVTSRFMDAQSESEWKVISADKSTPGNDNSIGDGIYRREESWDFSSIELFLVPISERFYSGERKNCILWSIGNFEFDISNYYRSTGWKKRGAFLYKYISSSGIFINNLHKAENWFW